MSATLSLSLLVGACGKDEASLKQIEQQIFTRTCATVSCHAAASPQANLVLAGSTHGNLVNVNSTQAQGKKRIVPGNPASSYLYEKITSTKPTVGERMPLGGSPLSADLTEMIRKWIAEGAANN